MNWAKNLYGISIYEPYIESYCISPDLRLRNSEFDENLLEFKETIKFKRYSIGFVSGTFSNELFPNISLEQQLMYFYNLDSFSEKLLEIFWKTWFASVFKQARLVGKHSCRSGKLSETTYTSINILQQYYFF